MCKSGRNCASGSTSTSTSSGRLGRQLALVRWLDGVHEGQFSQVDTTWIPDFIPDGPFSPEGYAVEWRRPPQPRNGWHVYNAVVVDVSDDVDFLKRREEEERQRLSGVRDSTPRHNNNPPPAATPANNEAATLRNLLHQLLISPAAAGLVQNVTPGQALPPCVDQNQVKVGKSLTVPRSIYLEAKASRSPTAMTMVLVRNSFSRRRLIKSSYAGQSRMRGGERNKKPGLKKYQKMCDIQDFVRSRFPTVSQSTFGSAVNSCLGQKAQQKEPIEYMEVSEEEEEEDEEMD